MTYEWLCLNGIDNGDGTSDQCGTRFTNDIRNSDRGYCPHCGVLGGFILYSDRNAYRTNRRM